MRGWVLVLLGGFAWPGVGPGQQTARCPVNSTYDTAHRENVADLRRALYSISQFARVGEVDLTVRRDLADASVYCLANIYTLRARFARGCEKITPDEYYKDIAANERFITLLSAAASSPVLWSKAKLDPHLMIAPASAIARLPSLALVGVAPLAFDPEISKQIEVWRQRGEVPRNPFWIAGSELLGMDVAWDERELTPLERRFEINPDLKISSVPLAESLSFVEKSEFTSTIRALAKYYVGRPRP